MRVFIAIDLSNDLQKAVINWQNRHNGLPVSWVKGTNLHATLIPPWEIDPEDLHATINFFRAQKFIYDSPEVKLNRVCYGPNLKKSRVIWAKGQANNQMVDLKERLEEISGVKSEYNPWLPHITIGKFNPALFSQLATEQLTEDINWTESPNSFVLMESIRTQIGTGYSVLARFQILGI